MRTFSRQNDFATGSRELALYTANEIARGLGDSKRNILSTLKKVSPRGTKLASGNIADAWSLESLPDPLIAGLRERSQKLGFKGISSLLEEPVEEWTPGPLSKIHPDDLASAKRLQAALKTLLIAQNNPKADFANLKEMAIKEYCRLFTCPMVTPRHLDRLIEMVMERDRGSERWDRVELFLPMKFRPLQANPASLTSASGFPMEHLVEALSGIADPAKPSNDDRAMIWRAAVECFLDLIESGHQEQRTKREIRKYLQVNAPWMGTSEDSLKKGLNAKITTARQQGIGAIQDLRKINSGHRRKNDFAADKLLCVEVAYLHEGNISLAHRLLMKGYNHPTKEILMRFSEEYRSAIKFNLRKNKSYVPEFIRSSVRPAVISIMPYAMGPRAVKLSRPCRLRDASDMRPNDWHTSDDETANSIVYWLDPNGPYECEELGRFNVGRPQILPLYDVASEMPLALSVSPTAGYSGDTIRDLIIPAWLHEGIGMPFQGCYFERGIWKSRHVKALTEWSQIDGAFRNLSLNLWHATTPRAKIIERVFGAEQARTAAFPGYVGRGNKGEHYERVHRFIQSLKKVEQPFKEAVDPRQKLWSLEKFTDELLRVMKEMAAEPKRGPLFNGRSPEEVWTESLGQGKPHEVLPPNLHYLLSTKQTQKKVTHDGVILSVGNNKYQFLGDRLGMMIGDRVNIRWSGRIPEYIVVTNPKNDPKGYNPFVVPLRKRLPSMTATKEEFDRARNEENEFVSGPRSIIHTIQPRHSLTVTRAEHGTEELRYVGIAHRQIEEHHLNTLKEQRAVAPKARELSRVHGLDTRGMDSRIVARELDGLDEIERQIIEQESLTLTKTR